MGCPESKLAPGRYAAIDIGTVTCRMLVADVVDGRIVPAEKLYAITNLGEGVDATHRLKPEAIARVAVAIDEYLIALNRLDAPANPVLGTTVMATSAARDAENASEFTRELEARGLAINVIPGSREAELSFMGASSSFPGERIMVIDVGGGSTEISIGMAGEAPAASHSFDIGSRRVTERFLDGYPPSQEAMDKVRNWIFPQFSDWLQAALPRKASTQGTQPGIRMVAVAGTATTVVSIRDAMEVYDSSRVHGATVALDELRQVEQLLSSMTLGELEGVVGLDPRRAPVITAGLLILEEAMRAADAASFTASESDILDGMIMYNASIEGRSGANPSAACGE